jgi:flagellar protein FliO/FliZ
LSNRISTKAVPTQIMHKSSVPVEMAYNLKASNKGKNSSPQNNFAVAFMLLFLATCPVSHCAAAAGTGSGVAEGSMLQVMLGLGFVLMLISGLAWLLRRSGALRTNTAGAIRVIGGSMVGQRERVVLLEISDTWLVIGVAPGHVTALHSMPKGEIDAITAGTAARGGDFSTWLRRVMEKHQGKSDE